MPLDVICPQCRGVYFQTNDKGGFSPYVTGLKSVMVQAYDPNRIANSAMINMKSEFLGVYDDIQHFDDLVADAIGPCPGCGAPLSNDNFNLETRPQPEPPPDESLMCHLCSKGPFKTEQGKDNHIRMIHGE